MKRPKTLSRYDLDLSQKMFTSCKTGNLKVVKLLLQNKADVNGDMFCLQTNITFSPSLDIVKLLIKNKADVNGGISAAISEGRRDILDYLIENKADVNFLQSQPLINACCKNDIELIKYLISLKANVTSQNNRAITISSIYSCDIVKLLVENNADPRAKNDQAFIQACSWGEIETINYLMSFGASPERLPFYSKMSYLQKKYYRKWRKIVLKKFIRKIIIPLYYSPRFNGYLKNIFTVSVSLSQNDCKVEEI